MQNIVQLQMEKTWFKVSHSFNLIKKIKNILHINYHMKCKYGSQKCEGISFFICIKHILSQWVFLILINTNQFHSHVILFCSFQSEPIYKYIQLLSMYKHKMTQILANRFNFLKHYMKQTHKQKAAIWGFITYLFKKA